MADVDSPYRASIDRARDRTLKRRHGATVEMSPGSTKLTSVISDDEGDWHWMVIDTFGTRSGDVAHFFLNHLVALCSTAWDEEHQAWVPDSAELTAILHIVGAHRPRNEAEAALAAQIAATHVITMKVAKRAFDYPYDDRTVATYAKLARTAAVQVGAMAVLKGKRRTARQQISVSHEKHIHHHQHVHMAGGVQKIEGQSDATPRADDGKISGARSVGECRALPGQDEAGRAVPIEGRARKEGVPDARRHQ